MPGLHIFSQIANCIEHVLVLKQYYSNDVRDSKIFHHSHISGLLMKEYLLRKKIVKLTC